MLLLLGLDFLEGCCALFYGFPELFHHLLCFFERRKTEQMNDSYDSGVLLFLSCFAIVSNLLSRRATRFLVVLRFGALT